MKRFFFLFIWSNFLIVQLMAIEPIRINESVSLDVLDSEYIINYKSRYCKESIVTLESEQGARQFSKLVYGEDSETIGYSRDNNANALDEMFDYVEGEGIPNIPFVSLNLQIPNDARYSVRVEDVQYIDIQTGEISSSPLPYNLSYAYLPCQEFSSADEQSHELQFDINEYSKEQFNELYTISEPYGALGTQGFTFNIFPFIYLPTRQSVIAIYSAKFVISVDGNTSLTEMMEREVSDMATSQSRAYGYDNYLGTTNMSSETTYKGKYLIITTSDAYANALTSYITHKRNIGYNVMLHVQSGGYTNATTLRNYIRSVYNNIILRPQFVLLVGNYSQIPISYGTYGDVDDPPTDIYYACLEKSTIGTETNFFPEVYIGRWPVNSTSEVTSIANKVISFEQQTSTPRVFELYSGTGTSYTIFESDNEYAFNKLTDISPATVKNIKGSYGYDSNYMLSEFANYNILMMVYNGHGNEYGLGAPYDSIYTTTIPAIYGMPRYLLGLACKLNTPQTTAFGSKWIRQGDRTICFYGATVTTNTGSDTYLNKHIFDFFKAQATNMWYSQFMQFAAGKYYNALQNSTRKKETKKYLFLGDPTTFTLGLYSNTGNPRPYSYIHKKDSDPQNGFVLNDTEEIVSIYIYNPLGHLVCNRQNLWIDDIYPVLNSLNKGIYIIFIKTTENEYVQKIQL